MRRLAVILIPLLLPSCGREATAPNAASPPSFAATTTWTRASLFYNIPHVGGPSTCVGEYWTAYGEIPYQMHEVSDAAGGSSYFYQFLPVTPVTPQFQLIGETSGTIWWYQYGLPYNESFRVGAGEVYRFKFHEVYESDAGERLFSDGWVHLTTNAAGVLVVERMEFLGVRCGTKH